MKTATVRDLRTRFPVLEGWLAEGEAIRITKAGKPVAVLQGVKPEPVESIREKMKRRFGGAVKKPKKTTDLVALLIEDRGE